MKCELLVNYVKENVNNSDRSMIGRISKSHLFFLNEVDLKNGSMDRFLENFTREINNSILFVLTGRFNKILVRISPRDCRFLNDNIIGGLKIPFVRSPPTKRLIHATL